MKIVGRKLLILARELDLHNEFTDVKINNLVPEDLRGGDAKTFVAKLEELDETYQKIKEEQKNNLISEDEQKSFSDDIQKITDEKIKEIENFFEDKKKEIMRI